jgi:hypothetical protein
MRHELVLPSTTSEYESKEGLKIAVFWVVAPCRLHGATTQKTAIFILTAVRTSNPTKRDCS